MRGIVFVVRSNSNGLHKIGVTKDWLRSSKQLQVGQQTTQIHTVWVNNALQIERYLQRRFRAKRMPQSDWFALDAGNLDFLRAVLLKARSDHQPPPPALPAQLSRPAPPPPTSAPQPAWSSRPATPPRPAAKRTHAPAPAAEPRRPKRPGYSVGVAPLVMLIWVMAGLLVGWLGMVGASQALVMAGIVMLSPFGLAAALLIGALLRQQRKQRLG